MDVPIPIPMDVPVPVPVPIPAVGSRGSAGQQGRMPGSVGAHPFAVGLGEPAQLALCFGEVQQDHCGEKRGRL